MSRMLRVSELAEVSGVSIRTLHYYDEIGLLRPSARSAAGYRLYRESEVMRLQQILIRRTLGFSLAEIGRALDDPAFDQRAALMAQREALSRRLTDTRGMIDSIDAALQALDDKNPFEEKQMTQELFDGFDSAEHEDEVRQRWGGTDAYRISSKRVKGYTTEDWMEYKAEAAAIYADLHALMAAGEAPASPAAIGIAERHRLSIDRWFYPCSHGMHAGLADMYEADARFRESIDEHGEGLAAYLAATIRANLARYLDGEASQ